MLQIEYRRKNTSEMKGRTVWVASRTVQSAGKIESQPAAGSKIVKPAGIVFEELPSDSFRDIIAPPQILCRPFRPVRVRVI